MVWLLYALERLWKESGCTDDLLLLALFFLGAFVVCILSRVCFFCLYHFLRRYLVLFSCLYWYLFPVRFASCVCIIFFLLVSCSWGGGWGAEGFTACKKSVIVAVTCLGPCALKPLRCFYLEREEVKFGISQ